MLNRKSHRSSPRTSRISFSRSHLRERVAELRNTDCLPTIDHTTERRNGRALVKRGPSARSDPSDDRAYERSARRTPPLVTYCLMTSRRTARVARGDGQSRRIRKPDIRPVVSLGSELGKIACNRNGIHIHPDMLEPIYGSCRVAGRRRLASLGQCANNIGAGDLSIKLIVVPPKTVSRKRECPYAPMTRRSPLRVAT